MKRLLNEYPGRLLIGFVGWAIICLLFWIFATAHFLRSLLVADWFCLSIVLGGLWFAMLHRLVGGAWGFLIRRFAESTGLTLPLLALLMLPIALDFKALYPWADRTFWSQDSVLSHRHAWQNSSMIFIRGLVIFAVWIYFAFKLRRESLAQDRSEGTRGNSFSPVPKGQDPLTEYGARKPADAADRENRSELLSRAGLVAAFITVSLVGCDWIMSRDPHWYSTAFGLLLIVSQALCGLAFTILLLYWHRDHPQVQRLVTPDRLHDLGNLLLMSMVLWAYISFFQFLVIWMGNEQDDITYYTQRNSGGWHVVTILLMVCNFALPFMGLLQQERKRDLSRLARVAAGLLIMQLIFILWMIAPSSRDATPGGVYWSDLFVIPFVVILWSAVAWFAISLAPPVPLYQPKSQISPEVEHDAQLAAD